MKLRYLPILQVLMSMFLLHTIDAQELFGFRQEEVPVQLKLEDLFAKKIKPESFKKHLYELCKEPHPASSPANERVKDYISVHLEKAGWATQIYPYDVYLSPDGGNSLIEIVTPERKPLNQQEFIVDEDPWSNHPLLDKGWNAWSGNGDVTSEVVYVNYGRKSDFEWLAKHGISVKGKIVIARYGGNFRGYKAKFAEAAGAIGLIIYTDPADSGYMKGLVYPEGNQFTGSSIQRGSLLTLDYTGDPLTPFQPALPLDDNHNIKRLNPEDVPFHNIPVLPIGYDSAKEILSLMNGDAVPSGWQGGLPFTYRIDGGEQLKVRMKVEQQREISRINNVIGTWTGSEYPDEWIILGCHYDAWTFGANDPNSGTALMMVLAESVGKLFQSGHPPKRSIILAHWDAEEHALIGSTEWVEQLADELNQKAVAYINLDAAVTGKRFSASASPSLKKVIVEATKSVPYPDTSASLFDIWMGYNTKQTSPEIKSLGGGSDHVAFYMHIGIPSAAIGTGGAYLYHTNYDNLYYYDKFSDPDANMGSMMEQLLGIITLRLSNADVIPYDIDRYLADLKNLVKNASDEIISYVDSSDFIGFPAMWAALDTLEMSIQNYKDQLKNMESKSFRNTVGMNQLNKRLLTLEKAFIRKEGMPFSPWFRSLYAASDPFSGYASWLLPGLKFEIELKTADRFEVWDQIYAQAVLDLANKINNLLAD